MARPSISWTVKESLENETPRALSSTRGAADIEPSSVRRPPPLRRELHGVDDVLVASAAAEVAGDGLADLVLVGVRVLVQKRHQGHQETRGAEAALEAVA